MFKKLFKFGKKKQEEANDNEVVNEHDTAIEENKDNLFEKNKASAQSNKVLGNKLLKNLDTYEKLIGDLGLNQV